MTLIQDLSKTCTELKTDQAKILDDAFNEEPPGIWIDDTRKIARLLELGIKPDIPPMTEPWVKVYKEIEDIDEKKRYKAFLDAVDSYPVPVQSAIHTVIQIWMGYLRDMIDQAAKDDKGKVKQPKDYRKIIKALGRELRLNTMDNRIYLGDNPITDINEAQIRSQLGDTYRGYSSRNKVSDAIMVLADQRPFHPLKDWLQDTSYDGGDHFNRLVSHFVDIDGIFPTFLRKWMIGGVARIMAGEFNPMLVLDGAQGIGKSYFARWLCPLPEYFCMEKLTDDSKDTTLRMIAIWIWEVAEFGSSFRKTDNETLKHLLDYPVVDVRPPYGKHSIKKPVTASFIGSINNEAGFLTDTTGNRRYLSCKITDIDWSYTHKVQLDKLWGEIYNAYIIGEDWKLNEVEVKMHQKINERYMVDDPIEGVIAEYFVVDPGNWSYWEPSKTIVDVLQDPDRGNMRGISTRGLQMYLGNTLSKLGLQRLKRDNPQGVRVNGYIGIKKRINIP